MPFIIRSVFIISFAQVPYLQCSMIYKPIGDLNKYLSIFVLLFLLTTSGCKKSQPVVAVAPYQEKYNQAYGNDSLRQFDLFLPEGHDQHTKVILLIHGGGWVSGDKWYCENYAKQFAAKGFAAVSMNYRLANDSIHFREILDDIAAMIDCISQNSGKWGVRNGLVALFGYSAGGHLALLYSYSSDSKRNVGAVVSLAGPTDVQDTLLWESPGLLDDIKLMTGDTLPTNWPQANPVHFINPTNPPTFLIHGNHDEVVPVSQSVTLNRILVDSNLQVKLLLMENETHNFSYTAIAKFLDETKKFLDANLK